MDYDLHAEGPWDLVVIIDTMCYPRMALFFL